MRASLFLLLTFISIVYGIDGYNQWCGKNYEAGSPAIAPSGAFIEPPAGSFDLRCTPTIQPYLSTDDLSSASLMLDYSDRSAKIEVVNPSTQRSILKNGPAISGKVLFKLADLGPPRIEPYVLECRVSNPIKSVATQFTVSFLPPNPTVSGSVVRKNAESGMLEVPGAEGSLRPFFPFGFYDSYDNYLALPNATSVIRDFQRLGINTAHPIPGLPYFTNRTELQILFTSLQEAGIWVQYDTRNSYTNRTQLDTQLNMTTEQPNLLVYYTADEPDGGQVSPVPAQVTRYLHKRDPYHPVSLVLNCQDYYFKEFTTDLDIVMTDPYPIGLKSTTFSSRWGTPCNTTYGDCGCDNCKGHLTDLSDRMNRFKWRRRALGRDRTLMIWGVPQAFNDSTYWTRFPTGQEFLTSCTIYVIEGAVGLMAWVEPDATTEIEEACGQFGRALPTMTPYLATPQEPIEVHNGAPSNPALARLWLAPDKRSMLLMAANAMDGNPGEWSVRVPASLENVYIKSQRILFSSAVVSQPHLQSEATGQTVLGSLGGLGCGAWILEVA